MILREAWQEMCVCGGGHKQVKQRKRESCEDTSTHERWEQVRARLGGELDGWREGERE